MVDGYQVKKLLNKCIKIMAKLARLIKMRDDVISVYILVGRYVSPDNEIITIENRYTRNFNL